MWALDNRTPFAADRTILQDLHGAKVWLVAVRGTYEISGGGTRLADVQKRVRLEPEHFGDPASSALRHDGDMVIAKPTTDVLLLGSAHSQDGRAVRELTVELAVGPVRKRLKVLGERSWVNRGAGLAMSDPAPFIQAALGYEHAFGGGDDLRNPAGSGSGAVTAGLLGRLAPSVLYPDGDRKRPAGFGPIARHWPPRLELSGTHDQRWREERFPLPPLDQDPRFFLCSPEDQRPPTHLVGGELVSLRHLSPGGALQFELPRVSLAFSTALGGEEIEHGGVLHTVLLEPDLGRVQMVWSTSLPCHHQINSLTRTRIELSEARP